MNDQDKKRLEELESNDSRTPDEEQEVIRLRGQKDQGGQPDAPAKTTK